MFKKGEYIIYGSAGVCEIMDITTMDIKGIPKDRLYYVLHPHYEKDGKIFTPVDNKKTNMRRIISKEEATNIIDTIPEVDALWIADDKAREEKYKECVKSCECRDWMKIIKALYQHKEERIAQGKKITATDERYLKQAEESLYSELSISFGVPKCQMEEYIAARIESLAQCEG